MDNNETAPAKEKPSFSRSLAVNFYDLVETLAKVTVFVMILFAFVIRLNIVSGCSMDETLYGGVQVGAGVYKGGDWLAVSDLGYEPTQGDIVIIHDPSAKPYDEPIVKRVIAVGGQTVDIDFDTWTVTVDGVVLDESEYLHLEGDGYTPFVTFPLTLGENEIFVLGDNRNLSADSRLFGPVDKRCVVGKALFRLYPLSKFTFFSNPLAD